ncbi:MAG: zinc ribbon domain-containing protein, partial [Bacillales bacterium]|nr:zinc ribbon domain-containing protein [Bacillales bacterium]
EEEAVRRMAYAEAEKTRAEGLAKADAMRAQGYTYAQETQREVGVAIANNEGSGAASGIGSAMSGVVQAGIGIGAAVSVGKATVGMMNGVMNDVTPSAMATSNGTWTCPNCGQGGNDGKFCKNCGAKKPESGTWTCPNCGQEGNDGKFCKNCGAKRG